MMEQRAWRRRSPVLGSEQGEDFALRQGPQELPRGDPSPRQVLLPSLLRDHLLEPLDLLRLALRRLLLMSGSFLLTAGSLLLLTRGLCLLLDHADERSQLLAQFAHLVGCRALRWLPILITSVRSARQLIDVLRAQGADIDIILAEVDLPIAKGFKMLKYIARDKDLRRIPIIMMSPQDEVSVVVKCLRLGAADYLVKPLRTNELLNLWTHMWRRRHMLCLSEKEVFNHYLQLCLSVCQTLVMPTQTAQLSYQMTQMIS